ncbi:MAG: metallophosphoesterase family protein [Anaerolineae bacterium]
MAETVYFALIGDTHIGPTRQFNRHGHRSLPCAQQLVEIINNLPVTPDFIVHLGDVVNNPDPAAYALAAETFGRLNAPVYYVAGNHDRAADIRRMLPIGPRVDLSTDPETLSYAFEAKGYRFLVLDARGPAEIDPHGMLSEAQLSLLRAEVQSGSLPLTVFIHFPCLPLNSEWMDENMLVINGVELHQALLPARGRLRAVFHGHVHQHMQTVRDGILYVSVASAFSQFSAWPGEVETGYDPDHLPAYGFVHLMPEQTIIHQHTFPRPSSGQVD